MNSGNFQQGPYLREQRKFPSEVKELSEQVDQAYIDIANKVNSRTIGIYSDNFMIVTGESWFLDGQPRRQQTLRRAYQFVESDLPNIPHQINFNTITNFTMIYGTFFDSNAAVWTTLPYVDVIDVTAQINITIDSTNIIITKGAGSTAVIESGIIVLEWLSQF